MEPVLLLCREVKAFPSFQLQGFSPKPKVEPSPEHKTELLSLMGLLLRRRLPFSEGQENRLQPPIRRTRDQKLKPLDLFFLNRHPILLPVDDLFLRGLPEEIRDILVHGLQDLGQAVQGDG